MSKEHRNALPQGHQLDDYVIEGILGAGGFGITYLAQEKTLDRKVAIKEFLPRDLAVRGENGSTIHPVSSTDLDDFEYGLERFRDEARTLVNFRHPNIIPVHRLMEANGTAYLIMEYEDGDSLQDIVDREGTLSEARIKGIILPILDGLDQVHRAGFLHRDIKPANIYIRHDGSPVLIDFGAARQALGAKSRSMTAVVSVGYAPMEQYSVRGKQSAATDIYALGATAYRAATGSRPPDAVERIEDDPYVPAATAAKGDYSPAFLSAIDWAVRADAKARPQSIAEWSAALTGQPVPQATAVSAGGATIAATASDSSATEIRSGHDVTMASAAGHAMTGGSGHGSAAVTTAPPPPGQRGAGKALTWVAGGLGVLIAISAGAGGWLWYEANQDAGRSVDARLATERQIVEQAEKRRKAEKARRRAELARRQALERARESAGGGQGTGRSLRLTIINKCNRVKRVYVAYVVRSDTGRWVSRGWIRVDRGGRISRQLATRSRVVYVYAEGGGRTWSGRGKSGSIQRWVRSQTFTHSSGVLNGAGAKKVWFYRKALRPGTSNYDWTLICTR